MTDLSQNIKNGQQLNASAGPLAIASGDVVLIGGPGGELWSAGTSDYAAVPSAGSLQAQTSIVAQAMPGSSRQPIARDKLGNLYIAGTKAGGNLVLYKYTPSGTLTASAVLDATATSVNTAQIFQLQNGAFAVVYARATGALYFVVFDAALSIIAGPISVATEYHSTNVVYHASCSLSGGGFAIAYQTNAGTGISLATYSNIGAVVLAAVSIQTLASGAAQQFLRLEQLSSGNLVCGYRGSMTAGGIAGTSFNIITVGGSAVIGPVSVDTVATIGFLELNVLTGFFAIADANGTNLIAGVYNDAGTVQGTGYSVGNTLNSIAYPQIKLTNDGTQFWLVWFSSVANGIYTIALPVSGIPGASASGLGSASFTASTFAMDAVIVNGLIVVFAASSALLGQFWMGIGLPDPSLGIVNPYIRNAPSPFGTAAATSGSNWPRIISSGAGLYRGINPPAGQPTQSALSGDFTIILVYDQQNVNATFFGIQKIEPTAIVGIALKSVAVNTQGSLVTINPGPGEYPANNLGGSSGIAFNHIGLAPAGTAGTLYSSGIALSGIGANVTTSVLLSGQCQLQYVSNTSIVLVPMNGNNVPVAGQNVKLSLQGSFASNAGVTINGLPNQNLAASTSYYVAFSANGALEFWTLGTGRSQDQYGTWIVAGKSGKTVVGIVTTDASSHFAIALMRSFFNRPAYGSSANATVTATLSSPPQEISPLYRVNFVCFSDDFVYAAGSGSSGLNNNSETDSVIAIDGVAVGADMKTNFASAFTAIPFSNAVCITLADGPHIANLFGSSGTGTGTWFATVQAFLGAHA
jgi:hypothetical protein